MTRSDLPSPELLRKLLRYEPETGFLYWRERDVSLFKDGKYSAERRAAAWNSRLANKRTFTSINDIGYFIGDIFGRRFYAHRVIWAVQTGAWPVDQIDHINHGKIDNRFINLREVTSQENQKNASIRSDNVSGFCGVCWHKNKSKWQAIINISGVRKHLGYFVNKSDAIAARKKANVKYGFHENHGSYPMEQRK